MTDFLLELRSEEIPARMQARAREDLARLFAAELAKAGLAATETITYATPRRLALIARGLPATTPATREETKGPRASAPPQALDGFLRKTGLAREQLVERDGVFFAIVERSGRPTIDVLAEAILVVVRGFPWPKSMRWGAASASTESLRWVRPLHGIVALLGEDVVPVEIAGIASGAATLGHRFHHPGAITIGSAADYAAKLRACHVIVDPAERETIVRTRAEALAAQAGLVLVPDEGLVAENAGLTEWPVPLLGRFDPAFLAVPPEVIQLTARVNQKYFVCRDVDGALANAFVCTANIAASDGGAAIVEGNRKVLAARLADARFFYETDRKVPLADQAGKLDRIVFHEKLGTVADKVDRVARLARWLVEEGIVKPSPLQGKGLEEGESGDISASHFLSTDLSPDGEREQLAALAERAARLCKADLVTGMVGEFPELQGVMGGYYATAQGEDPQVAAAIRDHYKPVGQGDDVPTAPVTVAVSLADKLDTLIAFWFIDQQPSGSRDPYALRRSALAVIGLITTNNLSIALTSSLQAIWPELVRNAYNAAVNYHESTLSLTRLWYDAERGDNPVLLDASGEPFRWQKNGINRQWYSVESSSVIKSIALLAQSLPRLRLSLASFFADRLKVQQREAGVRHDLIDAVFALGDEDDLVRLLARVRALQAFVATADGANLLAGYKRAANILKKEGWSPPPQPVTPANAGVSAAGAPESFGKAPAFAGATTSLASSAQAALIAALDAAEPAAAAAVTREDFAGAMTALATLRAPVDRFFDEVTVNDPDPAARAGRLALLARVRDAMHGVADFSRIEG